MLDSGAVFLRVDAVPQPKARVRARATAKGHAQFFKDARTRGFETSLGWAGRIAMGARMPITGPVSVFVEAVFPLHPGRVFTDPMTAPPDIDNIVKALDGLNRICWADDRQIVELRARKYYASQARPVGLAVWIVPGLLAGMAPWPT